MNPLIIIPTYNEAQNIKVLVAKILRLPEKYSILIVDDNSPDGTGKIADTLSKKYSKVSVIHRSSKMEIGDALKAGFKKALENDFDPIITMDADLSHDPVYLKDLLKTSEDYALVSASRYINGVRVDGWRFRKLLISKFASMFVAYLLVKPIWDFTSGYRCYRRGFLESINIDELKPEGYLVQIQLIYLAYKLKFGVKEIPFIYKDNVYGYSKINRKAIRKTFFHVFKFRAPALHILRHLTYLKKDYQRFVSEYEELLNPPKLKNNGKFIIPEKFNISIGIMAYNEEKNIRHCLDALLNQNLISGSIKEIIVVSSGSTDKTNEIVENYIKDYPFIKLKIQNERQGKASAINEYLRVANGEIAVLESADTITKPDTLEKLVQPFTDPTIGMVGAHPIPTNQGNGLVSFFIQKMWNLHHLIAMDNPKCGEMVAFRNIVPKIPNYTAVDEATIEAIFRDYKLKLHYCENAIIINRGPENIRDFIKQRRRIAAGHAHLKSAMGHTVSTSKSNSILKYVLKDMNWTPKHILYMSLLIMFEAYSRFLGNLDFHLKDNNPYIWDISKTTKHIYPGVSN